ncbi:MAG TPA: hypothetical protein VLZ54_11315 [Arenibacter sp.]|nr:hypothetical protein [Arenibacter sp.]
MKYEVSITGGFIGISRTYKGESDLGALEKESLLNSVRTPVPHKTDRLRDGFTYTIKLSDNDKAYNLEFDDLNIPIEVRMFIDSILKRNNSL